VCYKKVNLIAGHFSLTANALCLDTVNDQVIGPIKTCPPRKTKWERKSYLLYLQSLSTQPTMRLADVAPPRPQGELPRRFCAGGWHIRRWLHGHLNVFINSHFQGVRNWKIAAVSFNKVNNWSTYAVCSVIMKCSKRQRRINKFRYGITHNIENLMQVRQPPLWGSKLINNQRSIASKVKKINK